jgi:flagellar hook-associated protein 3 FlgL
MGTIRVTQGIMTSRVLTDLAKLSRKTLTIQDELSTGKRVNRPSDDPLAQRRAVEAWSGIAKDDQYVSNITTVGSYLSETETAISTTETIRQRAVELTIQGASGTNGQTQRNEIAIEINQLLEDTVSQANQKSSDRYIFGGTRSTSAPFTATRDASGNITAVTYQGDTNHFQVEIGAGIRVNANETGADVFTSSTSGNIDIFQNLIDIRDHLQAGNTNALQTDLTNLNAARSQISVAEARVGATQNRLERANTNLQDLSTQQKTVASDNVDADYAQVIIDLNSQSNALQASLSSAAKIIQPSLLNFIS